jgi:Cysteine sulfinate desulfinase/cysteine desulfurase and related enzymes
MGLSGEEAFGSLRITLGFENTYEEIDYFLETIKKIIMDLRNISPLYKKSH